MGALEKLLIEEIRAASAAGGYSRLKKIIISNSRRTYEIPSSYDYEKDPLYEKMVFYKKKRKEEKRRETPPPPPPPSVSIDERISQKLALNEKKAPPHREVASLSRIGKKMEKKGGLNIFELDFSLTQVSDKEKNSIRTVDFSWVPIYEFNDTFGVGFTVGGHLLIRNFSTEEIFWAIDTQLRLPIFLFHNVYLAPYIGTQRWMMKKEAKLYSALGVGVGYESGGFFKRIFVNFFKVGNAKENLEVKFGIGISF